MDNSIERMNKQENKALYEYLAENIKSRYKVIQNIETANSYEEIIDKKKPYYISEEKIIFKEDSIELLGIKKSDEIPEPKLITKDLIIYQGKLNYKSKRIKSNNINILNEIVEINKNLLSEEIAILKEDIKAFLIYNKAKKNLGEYRKLHSKVYTISKDLENNQDVELVLAVGKLKMGNLNLHIFEQKVGIEHNKNNYKIELEQEYKLNSLLVEQIELNNKSIVMENKSREFSLEEIITFNEELYQALVQEYEVDKIHLDKEFYKIYFREVDKRYLIQDYEKIIKELEADGSDLKELGSLFNPLESYKIEENKVVLDENDVLFPLVYNEEQYRILKVLENSRGITVQGPPGTGKSHTISNIVSHYMANGKRVLVTSEKPEALKVVIEKIPKDIQNLVVPLLSTDPEEKKRTEHSIAGIEAIIENFDKIETERKIVESKNKLGAIRQEINKINTKIYEDKLRENKKHQIGNEEKTLIEWTKVLDSYSGKYQVSCANIPLSEEEFYKIIKLKKSVGHLQYTKPVIAKEEILTVEEYLLYTKSFENITQEVKVEYNYLTNNYDELKIKMNILIDLKKKPIANIFTEYQQILKIVEECNQELYKLEYKYESSNFKASIKDQEQLILDNEGLINKESWSIIDKNVKVKKLLKEFSVAYEYEEFHLILKDYLKYIKIIKFKAQELNKIKRYNLEESTLNILSYNLNLFENIQSLITENTTIETLKSYIIKNKSDNVILKMRNFSDTAQKLYATLKSQVITIEQYSLILDKIKNDLKNSEQVEGVSTALNKLSEVDIKFIEDNLGLDYYTIQNKWHQEFIYAYLNKLQDNTELKAELTKYKKFERDILEEIIVSSTWLKQITKIDNEMKAKISEWNILNGKMGKGTGKKDKLRVKEIRKLLNEIQKAIPVWISPISHVISNFPLNEANKFDLIIIDEASQSSLDQLVLLQRGKKIMIVGDDKQISPISFMMISDFEERTQRYFGTNKPNFLDYDTTLFDYGKRTFNQIMLKEHFRCVEEIISFCNKQYYNNQIIPLRYVPSKERFAKSIEVKYVENARSENKINIEEIKYIIQLVQKLLADETYKNKTFGYISLLGTEQASKLYELLIRVIGTEQLEKVKFKVGNAYSFQGDERDVIILSFVHGSGNRLHPQTKKTEEQRYNVAVSRARDQLILVSSLQIEDINNVDCQRYKLLEYCLNYDKYQHIYEQNKDKLDSPFEEEVYKYLLEKNYFVKPQVKVNNYKIDFVIEGTDDKVALELDGERYHNLDNLEYDTKRQIQLERVGWDFIRIRGRHYYQDKSKTLDKLIKELANRNIYPQEIIEQQQ